MRQAAVAILIALVLVAPAGCLSGIAMVTLVAASPSVCGDSVALGDVPGGLNARASDGTTIRLDRTQLTHAAAIIEIGARTPGVGRAGVRIALMAALTESSLRMLANPSAHPESANLPNDGNGGDHDSLGLFQMRPSTGWGTVAELMNHDYQARAFFGGPNGPNHGSPRGLLDIPSWQQLPPGEAAQAVEVSAYPDRYTRFEPVANTVIDALTADHPAPDREGLATEDPVNSFGCAATEAAPPAGVGGQLVDDPTSSGQITARTAYVLALVRQRFPAASWSCWSPRPGTQSEHPLGRACDGTFGNPIGVPATGNALALGQQVTNWLQANAQKLGVEYLIWQGRIWSLARADEGWRPYGGGGMHDPASVTGGHYDHCHFTARSN
ncbi:hypothetical protein ACFWQC_03080 [Nocardioides sp. NPDC058538]|uniref:hypothetical protein n=1 Tax=Nocardioides sp. NPDC058538 TaxID=3346542 RepID=UPI0036515033